MIYTASMFQKGSMKLQKEELRHVLLKHCLEPVCHIADHNCGSRDTYDGRLLYISFSTLNMYHSFCCVF